MAKYPCVTCRKDITATKNNRFRSHTDAGEVCLQSGAEIPQHVLDNGPVDGDPGTPVAGVDFAVCPQCERKVQLTRLGYFEPHDTTMRGGERCEVSGVRQIHARRTEEVLLPGDEPASPMVTAQSEIDWSDVEAPADDAMVETIRQNVKARIDWSKVGDLKHSPPALSADSSASTEISSPESSSTPNPSPEPTPDAAPFSLGTAISMEILQPFSPFLQPGEYIPPTLVFLQPPEYEGPVKAEKMDGLAAELATKIKETFYAYSNRKSTDNRSAQTTLGPSEIGTPCDRRLAMALMGVVPVNPGGDGWAAFVGTCTHVGMAEIYTFADAGTGRYAVELPVFLGVPTVPRGTSDLLDRRDGTIVDWKVMGAYSLKKFKAEGPSATYRTQAHVYGLGAERGGERVKNVAIVGLPRAGSSLDEMHVWTEKYDRKFAQAALDRVEKIAGEVQALEAEEATWAGLDVAAGQMRKAKAFETGDDCRYCPFFLKKDKDMVRGCPGM